MENLGGTAGAPILKIVLEKENFALSGSPCHYWVITKLGDKYEFSYDFNDALFENNQYGYYYIKNNTKIKIRLYFPEGEWNYDTESLTIMHNGEVAMISRDANGNIIGKLNDKTNTGFFKVSSGLLMI